MMDMLAFFLISTFIHHLSFNETNEQVKEGISFVMVGNSSQYTYPIYTHNFIEAARESGMDAKFMILDVATDGFELTEFNIDNAPQLLCFFNGIIYFTANGRFDTSGILNFFYFHADFEIPSIETKEDLNHFYQTAPLGLLVAMNITDEARNIIENLHTEHYNEISIAYCKPSLLPKEGYYLYRFLDGGLEFLGDLTKLDFYEIQNVIVNSSVTDFHSIDIRLVQYMEARSQDFMMVSFPGSRFYFNPEQLEIIRYAKEVCKMNITASFTSNARLPGYRYGIDMQGKNGGISIIHTDNSIPQFQFKHKKYFRNVVPTKEEIKDMCEKYHQGIEPPFFKSTKKHVSSDGFLELSSYSLSEFVNDTGYAVVGVYYSEPDSLRAVDQVMKKMEKSGKIRYGRFAAADNDWPFATNQQMSPMPRLILFKDGKFISNSLGSNNTEDATKLLQSEMKKLPKEL